MLYLTLWRSFSFSFKCLVPEHAARKKTKIIPMICLVLLFKEVNRNRFANLMNSGLVMISKNQIKFIRSLKQKKFRDQSGFFIVEGEKVIHELLLNNWHAENIYTNSKLASQFSSASIVSENDLARMTHLKTSPGCLAVVKQRTEHVVSKVTKWVLVLDGVKDPGNLGTIIRIADWFGIEEIICSPDTVDCYNSKVIQSTMGAIFRIKLVYTDLVDFCNRQEEHCIIGAQMEGESSYTVDFPKEKGILVMGSESHGISEQLQQVLSKSVTIPSFGKSESLNVGVACGILLSELRRR